MTQIFPFDNGHRIGRVRLFSALTKEDLEGDNRADLIIKDLEDYVLPIHYSNVAEIRVLNEIYSGVHREILDREKVVRPDVNNKIPINYSKSFTRDIVAYLLGKPVQYVQREGEFREAVTNLCNALDAEGKELVDFQIATDMSVCGVGYRGVFTDSQAKNGNHLAIERMEPTHTFVVWSPDKEVGQLYCGTYYITPPNPKTELCTTVLTVYTQTRKLVFKTDSPSVEFALNGYNLISDDPYYLGGNFPIIEYRNNDLYSGDWESEISIMNAIDKLISDDLNDIEQFVNSILLICGMELDDETMQVLEEQKILNVADIPPGVNVDVRYIAEQLSYENVESLRDWLESTMRTIVGVPDRKNRGGGGADTGDAVFLRDGWMDIDLVAGMKEKYFIDAERQALATMIYIMKLFNEVGNVEAKDVRIKFSRTKQANLQAKAQAYSTMVGAAAPIAPEDALEFADLTTNVDDVIMRSEEYARKKLKETAEAQQMFMNNKSPQTTQSSSNSDNSNASSGDGDEGE